MEQLANIPKNGNLSIAPYSDKNSPTKFKVRGTLQLPKHSINKIIENKGIT